MAKYYVESLGCPKNLVDTHGMVRLLDHLGHEAVDDPNKADVLLVNTCGFVEDARQESIGELRDLARGKRRGQVLVAAGCLAQLWGESLRDEVQGVDALIGTRRWSEVGAFMEAIERGERPVLLGDSLRRSQAVGPAGARQGASAYLKIGEGCSAPCAFCAIPTIKGPSASRPAEDIVRDAVELAQEGAQEIILIAQDTTAYGRDRGERDALPDLVTEILGAAPRELRWLRIMYAYPGHVSRRLIEVMAGDTRVCHYLDLPLQHAHPDTLRRMRRPANVESTRQLIAALRAAMPDIALRTSFIVGYPGETRAEFQALLDFVREVRFDRVGVFFYSPERGTPAADLPDRVAHHVQQRRYERLMALQQEISIEINQAQIGRRFDVLVEGVGEGVSIGRSYRDAPEIDGMVLIPAEVEVGKMVPVEITGAMEYDLVGEVHREQVER
ncbi:MAG: 30S ribosomal protein S12 methylthiotransferase RimO [Anaerolineae bacterium]|nr:30S ribosomal protein S12 methylthiotransferase RimO [Anaerolineae bacterium]